MANDLTRKEYDDFRSFLTLLKRCREMLVEARERIEEAIADAPTATYHTDDLRRQSERISALLKELPK